MQLHGTYRRKDRIYTEDIFYGTGKKLSEATDAEKEADLKVCSFNLQKERIIIDYDLWLLFGLVAETAKSLYVISGTCLSAENA